MDGAGTIISLKLSLNNKINALTLYLKRKILINYYYFCRQIYFDFYEVHFVAYKHTSVLFLKELHPPTNLCDRAQYNTFPSFFLETYIPSHFFLICIPNFGLNSHNPAPYVNPHDTPLQSHIHVHTYPLFLMIHISPSFFRRCLRYPSYPYNLHLPQYIRP